MKCRNCGSENSMGALYCGTCGCKIDGGKAAKGTAEASGDHVLNLAMDRQNAEQCASEVSAELARWNHMKWTCRVWAIVLVLLAFFAIPGDAGDVVSNIIVRATVAAFAIPIPYSFAALFEQRRGKGGFFVLSGWILIWIAIPALLLYLCVSPFVGVVFMFVIHRTIKKLEGQSESMADEVARLRAKINGAAC